MTEEAKNILIIKPSALGDIVLALPALSAVRRSFGGAKISWLVRPEFAGMLEGHPHLDEIISFDRKLLGKAWYNPKALGALISLIMKLRKLRFDVVIDLQGLFRTAALGWLSGCKRRLGMANARELGRLFYTEKIRQTEKTIHVVDYYLAIAGAAGASDMKAEFVLPVDEGANTSIKRLLSEGGVGDKGYAVFIVGSAHADKCWPIERFCELADKVFEKYGVVIVGIGTVGEGDKIERLKELTSAAVLNLAGRTSVAELISLLRGARLVVGNDTGPGHVAAALGVPLVLIFGRANPIRIAPYGRPECVAAVEPFGRGVKPNNREPKYHVGNIGVDEVHRKVQKQLEGSHGVS